MARADVLLVSLGGTAGLREADAELAASLERAGAAVAVAAARPVREWRTMAAIELAWAVSARRAATAAIEAHRPRAIVYSSTTAALLAPARGAIRFDAPAAGNRPGRHGLWQRPVERRRLAAAELLVPWSAGGLDEAPRPRADAIVVPVPVEPSGEGTAERDVAAVTYGANPEKKGLDRVLAAWAAAVVPARSSSSRVSPRPRCGRTARRAAPAGFAAPGCSRAMSTARSCAGRACSSRHPRREDYGIAQLEALADGCGLVTTPSPGPYAALPVARALDPRLVGDDSPGPSAQRSTSPRPATPTGRPRRCGRGGVRWSMRWWRASCCRGWSARRGCVGRRPGARRGNRPARRAGWRLRARPRDRRQNCRWVRR
jgi:hypothetical protein